jgi:hypothetical protein
MQRPASPLFPAFDGDGFFVTLPVSAAADGDDELTWEGVYAAVVPTLRALGFERLGDLMIPEGGGVRQVASRLDQGVIDPLTLEFDAEQIEAAEDASEEDVSAHLEATQGMTLEQYRADIERVEIQYAFRQTVAGVPIEHAVVLASRWDGESVHSISGRVFQHYAVTNAALLDADEAAAKVLEAVAEVDGITAVGRAPERVELLLLPTGERDGVPGLRYAWRMPVQAEAGDLAGTWFAWLDAENAELLQLLPLDDSVFALGRAWRRDPGLMPATDLRLFQVDPSAGGQFVLSEAGIFHRVGGSVRPPLPVHRRQRRHLRAAALSLRRARRRRRRRHRRQQPRRRPGDQRRHPSRGGLPAERRLAADLPRLDRAPLPVRRRRRHHLPQPLAVPSRVPGRDRQRPFFTVNVAVSGFLTVDRDPSTPAPECYGTWTPSPLQWVPLSSGSRLYYRVRTQSAGGGNTRISTLPGNGLYTFPPPYAILNATGKPGCAVARFEYLGGTAVQRTAALLVMLLPLATIAGLRRRRRRRG